MMFSFRVALVGCSALAALPASALGTPFCPWDLNDDGEVNLVDLLDLLGCFGQPAELDCEAEDLNGDSVVNAFDLVELVLNFGPCPASLCPWDVNDDGVVDNSDLAGVLSHRGPCADPSDCPWDVNSDGVVNGLDVTGVATHFGVCPGFGACCEPDGYCSVTYSADCGFGGFGIFQGEGTDCESGCVMQGACCFSNGYCFTTFATPDQCALLGGEYQGDGTPCSSCPVLGVCCVGCVDPGYCVITTEEECTCGTWYGPSATCQVCELPP